MNTINTVLDRRIGIEDYLAWSTVVSVLLFVPFLPSIQLGYVIAIFNSALLLALNRLSIHRNHLGAILGVAAFSLISTRLSGISSTVIFAQVLGITVMSVYYFSVLTGQNLTLSRWMELYVWLAVGMAALGILLWPFSLLWGDGRLTAIYSEPSFFIYVTLPAVGYCINQYVTVRRYGPESLLFLLAYALADSALGFLGLILIALFAVMPRLKGWQTILGAIVFVGLLGSLYVASGNVRVRVDQTAKAVIEQDLAGVGASPFAFLSNVYVTSQSFAAHPFMGVGIGGYANTYDRYIVGITSRGVGMAYLLELQLNKYDANSMILRVAAELGLPGLIALFGFLIVCARVRGAPYQVIRNAILPYLLVRTARLGAYFTVELYFFVGIYLLNYLNYRKTSRKVPATAASLPYAGQPEPI